MKRKSFLPVLCLCIGMLLCSMRVSAAELKTNTDSYNEKYNGMKEEFQGNVVKVGWFECGGYFEKDKKENLVGFGVDYLNTIASYTGWEYEFIKSTREGCIQMLQAGEIDLMSPVGMKTELKNAKVSDEIIGENYGYIYKLGNNFKIGYEEYDKFAFMTIGMEKGSYMEAELEAYCERNNFTFYDIVYFTNQADMRNALANKKIDAMVLDSYVNVENLKVIGRFGMGCISFAASNKGIWEQLNRAMEELKLENPDYTEELRKLYFSESSQNNLEYSERERDFLSVGRTYKVALSKEQYPVSYQATQDGGHKGIALDILKKMEYYSNMDFEIIYVDSYKKGKEMLENGEVHILGGSISSQQERNRTVYTYEKSSLKEEYTVEFYEMKMAFIGRKETLTDSSLKVAIPPYMEQCLTELESRYPNYDFLIYDDDEECLNAILNSEADVAIQSDLKINELIIYDKYKELQNLKFLMGNYSVAFEIRTQDAVLVDIMNKTLNSISEKSLATIENNNIQHIAINQMTALEFLYLNREYVIILVILVITANIAWLGYRKYKEEEKNKERAYKDSIANISSMEKFRIDVEPILKSEQKLNYYMIAIDVDRFKVINELFGYEEGDRVIAYLAKILQKNAGEESFVARPNADFFVVLKKAYRLSEAEDFVKKVFAAVEQDITEHDNEYRLILKAGIYKVREEDYVLSSIMDKADLTKNNMATKHQSSYALYSEEMHQRTIDNKKMENDMEYALKNDEFKLYLQPQVDLRTKKMTGAEALVRWIHGKKGMIPSGVFIPLFEKNGFISKLDVYIWEETVKTLARWRDQGKIMVPISINLSRVDIENEAMIPSLKQLLDRYEISPEWVKVELTESVCLENDKIIVEKMEELKKYGLKIAIDDFGSGYSSLNLLKKMPVDIMKIDKSFLDYDENLHQNEEIVIRDVVELGKHLRMQIIVEGVETSEQSRFLESIGCDIAQGYYYGKPMPVEEFEVKLRESYR